MSSITQGRTLIGNAFGVAGGRLAASAAVAAILAGCVAVEPDRTLGPSRSTNAILGEGPYGAGTPTEASSEVRLAPFSAPAGASASKAGPSVKKGSGAFVDTSRRSNRSGRGSIVVNLVDVEAREAIQQILGEMLGLNYVIEGEISGTLTIQTTKPVDQRSLLQMLSSALASKDVVLINEAEFYRIAPKGTAGNPSHAVGYGADLGDIKVGPGVQIVPLRHISALEMERILKPIAGNGAIARVDVARNLLILKEDSRNLESLLELIDLFDVDYMAGMSFALIPVKNTSASGLIAELDQVFGAHDDSPMAGLVRFVPIERLNAILAITAQPNHLDQVQDWIGRLDASGQLSDQSFYVLPLQNRPANEVAELLQKTLSADDRSAERGSNFGVSPGLTPVIVESPEAPGGTISVPGQERTPDLAKHARIRADEANNSLVILATPEQFQALEQVVDLLDVTPNQVLLEATIAEVTLRDDLSYGLTWFLQSGEFDLTFSDAPNGAVAETFPGFSVLFNGDDGRMVLSAVASVTDVKVLSSPTLMVLDNRTATLQVGDQVPIVTQTAVSTIDPEAPIVNEVSLRDTGVILKVTPRVNEGGRVMLDIEQEVSDVVETQSSGIDSPTIQQRRIKTSVAVDDGSTIALGGLIRDRVTDVVTKIPLLGDIPGLGELFRSTGKKTDRTELVVLITATVVTGPDDARQVTRELRERMRGVGAAMEAAARRSNTGN